MNACNDYQTTRRRMLKMFSASMLGMPISGLLARAVPAKATAEHVILFWNDGGMSHLDTWDPKPGRKVQGGMSACPAVGAHGLRRAAFRSRAAANRCHRLSCNRS